jgi:signal transduction histidine kinase
VAGLRNHAEALLRAIAADLRTEQTELQQDLKARGLAPLPAHQTAAQAHALLRAERGFSIRQLVSEYRALRASVLHQYLIAGYNDPHELRDIGRFNEAIDQAVTESVDFYTALVDRWRNIFLGVLGHDLRAPLQSILLTADLVSQRSPTPETAKDIERVRRSGERMAELLDDLLDYSRVAIGRARPL